MTPVKRANNRRYYLKNRERLKAKALERHHKVYFHKRRVITHQQHVCDHAT